MSATRFDIYGPIHKAIRAALSDLLVRLGRTDFTDPASAEAALAALRAQLRFGAMHIRHEEEHIHSALFARAPETVDELRREHDAHAHDFAVLEALIAEIETAAPGDRAAAGRRLYLAFAGFVAHDLEHMAHEEQAVGPLLQSLFTDAELQAMEGAIVASMPPETALSSVAMLIPALNPAERAAFLTFVRDTAPPPVFEAMVTVAAKPTLPVNDWRDLAERLGVAA